MNIDSLLPALLTPRQAADLLQVPTSTLAVWRSTGRVQLPYLKLGRHVRYRRDDVERWLREHEVRSG
ncbi:MAG: helix-turn-helix domain-containing protein [Piscinibacter sp.]